jgi:general secretion pathway protein C
MKRLPVLSSFIIVLVLSASLAYWAMQLLKPPERPIAIAQVQNAPPANLQAAAGLFGGQSVSSAASNYRLTGVIAAGDGSGSDGHRSGGHRSAAIMVIDGKAPQAVPVGRAVAPGVLLTEVHPKYVLLSDGGTIKRVDLDANPKGAGAITGLLMQSPVDAAVPTPPVNPAPPVQTSSQPGAVVVPPQGER